MAVYHKFGPADIIHYSLSTAPKTELASGSSGWKGNVGTSGELSIFGGIRSRELTMAANGISIQPICDLLGYAMDGSLQVTGSYPHTGSVDWVKCRNSALTNTTNYDWDEKYFSVIMNLYDYYERYDYDYNTGSYDYYCIYSQPGSSNYVTFPNIVSATSSYNYMTSSYAIEGRFKPLHITGSGKNRTLVQRGALWSLYLNDTDGRIAFSASDGSGVVLTSSRAPDNNRWSHIAYSVINNTGSFTINMVDAGQYIVTGSLDTSLAATDDIKVFSNTSDVTFHGFGHDIKVWNVGRTWAQLSASFDKTHTEIEANDRNLIVYGRFNDGPLRTFDAYTMGSGAMDYSDNANPGELTNFDFPGRDAPVWHPCDDRNFTTTKTRITSSINFMRILHIPSLYYGRQIQTGSLRMTCNAYLSSSLKRTLVDDGRGGLYLSGSASSSSLENAEHYKGVEWPKVGNVFYSEGIVVIKDPALYDFGDYVMGGSTSPMASDVLQVSFRGAQTIPTKVMQCRINGAASNASNNKTFTTQSLETGKYEVIREKPITYITAVGIYNEERKLVAVAKLAQPVRNREKDRINLRLKLDF